jgi:hypothetical protein
MNAFAESWHDEASIFLPDRLEDIETELPGAIARAESELMPSHPGEVISALQALADRRGFDLPNSIAFEMDVEVMAGWPKDLFQKAFHMIWERFSYRRLPEVADFFRHIETDMAERRERLTRLQGLALRLRTAQQRREWDEQARARHAAIKQREREAMRAAMVDSTACNEPCDLAKTGEQTAEPHLENNLVDDDAASGAMPMGIPPNKSHSSGYSVPPLRSFYRHCPGDGATTKVFNSIPSIPATGFHQPVAKRRPGFPTFPANYIRNQFSQRQSHDFMVSPSPALSDASITDGAARPPGRIAASRLHSPRH